MVNTNKKAIAYIMNCANCFREKWHNNISFYCILRKFHFGKIFCVKNLRVCMVVYLLVKMVASLEIWILHLFV